jgi:hypothetical protein
VSSSGVSIARRDQSHLLHAARVGWYRLVITELVSTAWSSASEKRSSSRVAAWYAGPPVRAPDPCLRHLIPRGTTAKGRGPRSRCGAASHSDDRVHQRAAKCVCLPAGARGTEILGRPALKSYQAPRCRKKSGQLILRGSSPRRKTTWRCSSRLAKARWERWMPLGRPRSCHGSRSSFQRAV